jgi:hypothetical protein
MGSTIINGHDVKWLRTWFERAQWLQTWQNGHRVQVIYNARTHCLNEIGFECYFENFNMSNSFMAMFMTHLVLRFSFLASDLTFWFKKVNGDINLSCTYFEIWRATFLVGFFYFFIHKFIKQDIYISINMYNRFYLHVPNNIE